MNFSVLISVYFKEKAAFLYTALTSIFEQTVEPDEVVLIKDGPLNDELDAVIETFVEKYSSLKVISLPKNVGLGNALNEGLKYCTYDLVARMDSDDICYSNRFELQIAKFKEDAELSVVGSWVSEFITEPSLINSIRKLPETNQELIQFGKSKSPLNHPSVMFRKSDIIEVGGYQHFYLLEDYWLWVRLISADKKLYNIQQPLVNMRGGYQMAARRGGWKYAKSEVILQLQMRKLRLISFPCMLKNIYIRFTIRIMPNSLRAYIYKKFLRS